MTGESTARTCIRDMSARVYETAITGTPATRNTATLAAMPQGSTHGAELLRALVDADPQFGYLDRTHERHGLLVWSRMAPIESLVVHSDAAGLRAFADAYAALAGTCPVRRSAAAAPPEATGYTRALLQGPMQDVVDCLKPLARAGPARVAVGGYPYPISFGAGSGTDEIDSYGAHLVHRGARPDVVERHCKTLRDQVGRAGALRDSARELLTTLRHDRDVVVPPNAHTRSALAQYIAGLQDYAYAYPSGDPRDASAIMRLRQVLLELQTDVWNLERAEAGQPPAGALYTPSGAALVARIKGASAARLEDADATAPRVLLEHEGGDAEYFTFDMELTQLLVRTYPQGEHGTAWGGAVDDAYDRFLAVVEYALQAADMAPKGPGAAPIPESEDEPEPGSTPGPAL